MTRQYKCSEITQIIYKDLKVQFYNFRISGWVRTKLLFDLHIKNFNIVKKKESKKSNIFYEY